MSYTLDQTEAEDVLRTARRFVTGWAARRTTDGEAGPTERRALVRDVAELGWQQMLVADGGVVTLGNMPVVSKILMLTGESLLPDIVMDAVATTPLLVAACGAAGLEVVGDVTDGSRLVPTAFQGHGADGAPAADPFSSVLVDGYVLQGTKVLVRDADSADGFLVSGRRVSGEPILAWVAVGDGVAIAPQRSIDAISVPARVQFEGVRPVILLEGRPAQQAVARAQAVARLGAISRIAGVAESVTNLSAEYARSRVQFGRPIGSFQAVKHLLADMWRETYQADCVREELALRLGDPTLDWEDVETATRSGKAWSGRFIQRCVESALQVHGGYGFTAEGPLSGFYLHALMMSGAEGSPRDLDQQIGEHVLRAVGS